MPNTFSSVIVMATLQIAQAILAEAALSFLGLGTGQTYPSWGQMIALGRDYINVAWWLSTFPGMPYFAYRAGHQSSRGPCPRRPGSTHDVGDYGFARCRCRWGSGHLDAVSPASRSALASWRSAVSKPSVNQP